MPIDYRCPHCGKQYSVAEQYAGQTGPCAACGQKITIPLPAGQSSTAPLAPSKGTGFGMVALIVGLAGLGGMCLIVPVLVALLLPAVQAAREAARRTQCANNLRMITLALQQYHNVYENFPPAVVTDSAGNPLYSGRVLLLPYLEQQALYDQFDLSKPWDSGENNAISQTRLKVFEDPSSVMQFPGETDYVFVTGKGTTFEGGKTKSMADIMNKDGATNTMVVVEVANSGIHWAEPKDVDFSQPIALPPGNHPMGSNAAFADGRVQFIRNTATPSQVRGAATIGGKEPPSQLPQ